MLNVSNAFNEAFKSDLREVKMRVTVNDVTYTDEDIISFNYNSGSIVGETYAIGSTFANSIKLTLCKIVEGLKQLDVVKPEMGIVLPNGSTEFVKLGTFLISEQVNPDRNENRTSLECTDKMLMLDDKYESKLSYPAEIRAVALEIANLAGVEVDKVSFSRLKRDQIQKPEGYTLKQAIGIIAQFEAGYATFDREGLLSIKQLTDKNFKVTPNEYFQNGLTKNELKFRPAGIQVKVSDTSEDDKVLKIGNEKGSVIHLENKVMTDGLLKLVYDKVKNINYYPYTLKWRGNPAVEVGDWLQVTDTKGNLFKVPNLSYSFEYKGGLTATSTVETVASNEVRFGYKKILDQVVELVENSIKDLDGNVIYYGVEAPPNPKEGDTWFKYVDSDTEIWVYEKVAEPDVFDWVFKISSAVDETIKEKIEQLEEDSKQQQLDVEKALNEAEEARVDAEKARKEAFDSTVISRQAERDALNALAQGDKNKTEITKLDGQQKLTNTKVEGNTANILQLESNADKLSLSLGKVQSDVDGISTNGINYMLNSEASKTDKEGITYYPIDLTSLDLVEGDWLTVSLYLKNNTPELGDKADVYLRSDTTPLSGSGSGVLNITENFKRYNYSFQLTDNIIRETKFLYVRKNTFVGSPVNKDILRTTTSKVQVEKGKKLNDWRLNPIEVLSKSEFATFEGSYKGFQLDVKNDFTGLHSQQTIMDGQIASTVEKIDNLEVGSRNYILNSEVLKTDKYLTEYKINLERLFVLKAQFVTVSFEAKSNNEFGFIDAYLRNVKDGKVEIVSETMPKTRITSRFERYSFSFKISDDVDSFGVLTLAIRGNPAVDSSNIGKTFSTQLTKLEKGTIKSDWSPAPEDNASKSEVIQLSDQITQTVNKVETVDGKVTSQQSQITQLSNNISLKVDKDNAIAQINLSPESIRLDAKFIHLSGKSLIDDAVIKTAHIDNLAVTGAKIQDATISSAKIIDLDVNKLNSGVINSNLINVYGTTNGEYISIKGNALTSYGTYNRTWDGATTKDTIIARLAQGYLSFASQNEDKTLSYSNFGISTRYSGNVNDASGTIEFFSTKYGQRGITSSALGANAVESKNGEVFLDSRYTTHIISRESPIVLKPFRDNTSKQGSNVFTFSVGDGTSSTAHGYLLYGSETFGSSTGIRLEKDSNNPSIYFLGKNEQEGVAKVWAGEYRALDYRDWSGQYQLYMSGRGDASFQMNGAYVLRSNGICTNDSSASFYLGTSNEVRVTGRNGYNNGNTITYMPIRASNFITNSQASSKQNIYLFRESALDLINSSEIYNYRLRNEVNRGIDVTRIGLIIGDGYSTPDEVVETGGINQYSMISYAWKAIQELNEKIKRLEERLEHANVA